MKTHHKNNEPYYIKKIVSRYSESEAILALNRRIKQLEFDNGVLKTENAELNHENTIKYKELKKQFNELQNKPIRADLKMLKSKVLDLEHQLIANGIPLPKKYQ